MVTEKSNQTGVGNWVSEKAIVFEGLNFLFSTARTALLKPISADKSLSSEKKRTHTKERWKKVYHKDHVSAQWVGHVVQLIIRAWNLVAENLAFPSAGSVLMPYLLFSLKEG